MPVVERVGLAVHVHTSGDANMALTRCFPLILLGAIPALLGTYISKFDGNLRLEPTQGFDSVKFCPLSHTFWHALRGANAFALI